MSDLTPAPCDLIVVWFSCGAASAVAAKKTIEKYGNLCQIRIVNNPVVEEDPDNRRFMREVGEWLGKEIEETFNKNYPGCSAAEVWSKRKFMAGPTGAPCTIELKKRSSRSVGKREQTRLACSRLHGGRSETASAISAHGAGEHVAYPGGGGDNQG